MIRPLSRAEWLDFKWGLQLGAGLAVTFFIALAIWAALS